MAAILFRSLVNTQKEATLLIYFFWFGGKIWPEHVFALKILIDVWNLFF